jgi:hypothetical protein
MAYEVPEIEPLELTAGDLVTWTRTFADFSAADGWVLSYALTKDASSSSQITFTASTYQTTDFIVSVAKATTANWTAARYTAQGYVTKAATSERYQVYSGSILIRPNLAAATGGLDVRSHARKVLDAIESVIESRAGKAIQTWSGLEQSFSLIPTPDLLKMRDQYTVEWNNEKAAERIRLGLGTGRNVFVRFTTPR